VLKAAGAMIQPHSVLQFDVELMRCIKVCFKTQKNERLKNRPLVFFMFKTPITVLKFLYHADVHFSRALVKTFTHPCWKFLFFIKSLYINLKRAKNTVLHAISLALLTAPVSSISP